MFFHQVQKSFFNLPESRFISVRTLPRTKLFISTAITRYTQRNTAHQRKWTCKHESHHKRNEHKNMSNKHHLREFRVAFLCFYGAFLLLTFLAFWFCLERGIKKKKNVNKMNGANIKKSRRRKQRNRKIELSKKKCSTDMKCW